MSQTDQRTIYLHIGTQKTGTTTLQSFAQEHRERLQADGILFPTSAGGRSHSKLAIWGGEKARNRDLRRDSGLLAEEAFRAFQKDFPDQLRAEIESAGSPRVLLSNELLSARLRHSPEVERLAALLHPLAQRVVVIVYLRRQSDLFLSTYSTAIRSGNDRDLDPLRGDRHPYYNYERMLDLWAAAFGTKNIVPRLYDRAQMRGGSLLPDFFEVLEYAPPADLPEPKDRNKSLDTPTLEFLRLFHRHVPRFADDKPNAERGDVVRALAEISRGPLQGDPEVLRAIDAKFAASNAAVARRYFGREGDLFAAVQHPPRTAAPLSVEQAVEIAAHLWRFKHRQMQEPGAGRPAKPRRANTDAQRRPAMSSE